MSRGRSSTVVMVGTWTHQRATLSSGPVCIVETVRYRLVHTPAFEVIFMLAVGKYFNSIVPLFAQTVNTIRAMGLQPKDVTPTNNHGDPLGIHVWK